CLPSREADVEQRATARCVFPQEKPTFAGRTLMRGDRLEAWACQEVGCCPSGGRALDRPSLKARSRLSEEGAHIRWRAEEVALDRGAAGERQQPPGRGEPRHGRRARSAETSSGPR